MSSNWMRKKRALCKESKILSSQQWSRNTVMKENTFIIDTDKSQDQLSSCKEECCDHCDF